MDKEASATKRILFPDLLTACCSFSSVWLEGVRRGASPNELVLHSTRSKINLHEIHCHPFHLNFSATPACCYITTSHNQLSLMPDCHHVVTRLKTHCVSFVQSKRVAMYFEQINLPHMVCPTSINLYVDVLVCQREMLKRLYIIMQGEYMLQRDEGTVGDCHPTYPGTTLIEDLHDT